MSERRIDANLNSGARLFRESDSGRAGEDGTPAQADEQDRSRFEQAMEQEGPSGAAPVPQTPAMASPFSLFGAPSPSPSASQLVQDGLKDIQQLLERLMVSQEGSAPRVRMDLNENQLPGVTVTVYEDKGVLTVEFICRNEESRQRLNQSSRSLAEEMAHSLNRPVVWRVMTDDDEDLRLLEVLGVPK